MGYPAGDGTSRGGGFPAGYPAGGGDILREVEISRGISLARYGLTNSLRIGAEEIQIRARYYLTSSLQKRAVLSHK